MKLKYFDAIYKNSNIFPFYMIIYTTFERSRRIPNVTFCFWLWSDIRRKTSTNMEKTKKVPIFRDFHVTFRLLVNSGGIFHNSGPEFRLLVIPVNFCYFWLTHLTFLDLTPYCTRKYILNMIRTINSDAHTDLFNYLRC